MRNGYSDTCAQKPCACSEQDKVTMAGRKETEPDVLPESCKVHVNVCYCCSRHLRQLSVCFLFSLTPSTHSKNPHWNIIQNFLSFYSIIIVVVTEYFHCVMSSISFLTVLKKKNGYLCEKNR